MSLQDRDYMDYASVEPVLPVGRRGDQFLGGWGIVNVLIAVNVAVFVLAAFFPAVAGFLYGDPARGRMGQADLVPHAVMKGQVWRLFTAQYLHSLDFIIHILFNMIALHFLGRPLERMWSARKFFVIYTLCGLFGNAFYVYLSYRGVIPRLMPAVGASGCVYGLLGIVAVLFPDAKLYIYFLFPVRIRTAAIFLAVLAFITVQTRGGNYGGEACHLAGLVFGVWWAAYGDRWWSSTEWGLFDRRR